MDLSPNDIRNYEFNSQMRGFDKEEVKNLLEQMATAIENSKQENLRLSMEVESLKSQLSGLKQFEDTIKSAAIDARRNADMTVANAKQEAELLLSRARGDAEKLIATRSRDVSDIEAQITKLALTKKSYLNKVRSMIKSHLDLLEEVASGEIEDKELEDRLEVTETQDVTSDKRETLASEPEQQVDVEAEEAEATEEQSDELSEASKAQLTDALKDALKTDGDSAKGAPVDPELAAALEKYKHDPRAEQAAEPARASVPTTPPPAPQQDQFVETSRRAEDIPPGFVSSDGSAPPAKPDTNEVKTSSENSMEHNAIDMDAGETKPEAEPADLAKELDNVVAKFEEEMDKAEKN